METSIFSQNCPTARIQPSPLMFESENEDELDGDDSVNSSNKENANESAESTLQPTKEEKLLKGFQTVLMGIPPPPAFTVPQLDCREILKLWRDHQKYRVVVSPGKGKQDLAEQVEEIAKTTKWPDALRLNHWDIYYNKGCVSEEVERLSLRYKERYVGAETSSCINALFIKSPTRTASARKRARYRAWGHSPGRRLSHLARRRKAFSASMCSVAGNNPDKKMILVEIKKIGNRQNKKNSAKKRKPTPQKIKQAQANTYKRALFQSPDQLLKRQESQTPNSQVIQRSKRNLFVDSSSEKINENGKRDRPAVRRMSPCKRVNRSLSFQDSEQTALQSRQTHLPRGAEPSQTVLTGPHKQKMLWAATNALRDEGMGMNHELFRPCMTVLFKTCQRLWLMKVAKQGQEGSTSEKMLELTKQFSAYTIKEINADPTSEHMVLVCSKIMKLAENTLNQPKLDNQQPSRSTLTSKLSCLKENINAEMGNNENSKIVCNKTDLKEQKNSSETFICDKNNAINSAHSESCVLQKDSLAEANLQLSGSQNMGRTTRRTSCDVARNVIVNNAFSSAPSEKKISDSVDAANSVKSKIIIPPKQSPAKDIFQLRGTLEKSSRTTRTSSDLRTKDAVVQLTRCSIQSHVANSSRVRTEPVLSNAVSLTSPVTRSRSASMNGLTKTSTDCNSEGPFTENIDNNSTSDKNEQPSEPVPQRSSRIACPQRASSNTRAGSVCLKGSDDANPNNAETTDAASSPIFIADESEKSLSQRSNSSETETKVERDFETNKENLGNQHLISDCREKTVESERNCWNQRPLLSVENKPRVEIGPTASTNKMLQPYRLPTSIGENVQAGQLIPVVDKEPPKLIPHWEQENELEETSPESPPSLIPHWQPERYSSTSTSLPEYIMAHWQNMSNNVNVNDSDKIMFDFEDTSYEISFPSINDDSRASSTCVPFDFPNLVDDSRSYSCQVFGKSNSDSYD